MPENSWVSFPCLILGYLLISFHFTTMPGETFILDPAKESFSASADSDVSSREKVKDRDMDNSATKQQTEEMEIGLKQTYQQLSKKLASKEAEEVAPSLTTEEGKESGPIPIPKEAEKPVSGVPKGKQTQSLNLDDDENKMKKEQVLLDTVHKSNAFLLERSRVEGQHITIPHNVANIIRKRSREKVATDLSEIEEDNRLQGENTEEESVESTESVHPVRNEDIQPSETGAVPEHDQSEGNVHITTDSKMQKKVTDIPTTSGPKEEYGASFIEKDLLYSDVPQSLFAEKFPDLGKVDLEPEPPPVKAEIDLQTLSAKQGTETHETSEVVVGQKQEKNCESACDKQEKHSRMTDIISEEQGVKEDANAVNSGDADDKVDELKLEENDNEKMNMDTEHYVVKAKPKVLDKLSLSKKVTGYDDDPEKDNISENKEEKQEEIPDVSESFISLENATNDNIEDNLLDVISENITKEASERIVSTQQQSDNGTEIQDENEQKTEEYEKSQFQDEIKGSEEMKEGEEEKKDRDEKVPEHEYIPSFSEWTQKQLEEAEKKKGEQNTTTTTNGVGKQNIIPKMRSKNYASLDCGAKIIAANPESQGTSNIISPLTDEYMLNACTTSKIWFVVELCEAIQAKKIDIANFELFSSGPKEFVVYISDRYPTREWLSVGGFTAEDDRKIQSFNLDQHLFGKFVKVEFLSHHGAEHYCPLSLFQVYGTSEYEVLETENQENHAANDEDDDDFLDDVPGGPESKNLIGSATEAVLSMVKKAAEVFRGDKRNQSSGESEDFEPDLLNLVHSETDCDSLIHEVVCEGCSETLFMEVYTLLSCSYNVLLKLLDSHFIYDTLISSDICGNIGLDFRTAYYIVNLSENKTINDLKPRYITFLLGKSYVAALCNMIAAEDGVVSINSTLLVSSNETVKSTVTPADSQEKTEKIMEVKTKTAVLSDLPLVSSSVISTSHIDDLISETESDVVSMIQPTKTLKQNNLKLKDTLSATTVKTFCTVSSSHIQSSIVEQNESTKAEVIESSAKNAEPSAMLEKEETVEVSEINLEASQSISLVPDKQPVQTQEEQSVLEQQSQQSKQPVESVSDGSVQPPIPDTPLDSFISEMTEATLEVVETASVLPSVGNENSKGSASSAAHGGTLQPGQHTQKESVFVRLSSRIKALERNMSLSSQYLEELSKRYKKQMEEMQRSFNKTVIIINETARKAAEHEVQHQEALTLLQQQIRNLTTSLSNLVEERELFHAKMIERHLFLLLVEILVISVVFIICQRRFQYQMLLSLPQEDGVVIAPRIEIMKDASCGPIKKQRKSEGIGNGHQPTNATVQKLKPSEEALNISETCHDLLSSETSRVHFASSITLNQAAPETNPKKKKKKKKEIQRVHSLNNLIGKGCEVPSNPSVVNVNGSSAGVLFSVSSLPDCKTSLDSIAHYQHAKNKNESTDNAYRNNKQDIDVAGSVGSWDNPSMDSQFNHDKQHSKFNLSNKKNNKLLRPGKLYKSEIVTSNTGNMKFLNGELNINRSKSLSPVSVSVGHDSNCTKQKDQSPRTKLKSDNWEWYRRESSKNISKESIPDHASNKSSQLIDQHDQNGHSWTRKNGPIINKNENVVQSNSHLPNGYR